MRRVGVGYPCRIMFDQNMTKKFPMNEGHDVDSIMAKF